MPWRFAKFHEERVSAPDAGSEFWGTFGKRDHAVTPSIGGKAVDEIYDAVLQAPGGESVDDVQNQARRGNVDPIHDEDLSLAFVNTRSISGDISRVNVRRTSNPLPLSGFRV
jgi:hypothetical protein